ncbi:MAG: trimethylamine methyltransferase family protein [Kiritimatiellia bacterium]
MENALTFCPEQLVIDAEIAEAVRHLLRGITVDDETLGVAAIRRVGPGGNFLTDEHTLDHFLNEVRPSRLFECYGWDVGHRVDWESVVERARRIAHTLMEEEPRRALSREQEKEIDQIAQEAAADFRSKTPLRGSESTSRT